MANPRATGALYDLGPSLWLRRDLLGSGNLKR